MTLALSTRDVARYRDTIESLLSAADYGSASEWSSVVLRRVEALFGADRSMLVLPTRKKVRAHSESIPRGALDAFEAAVSEVGPRGYRSMRPDMDSVLRMRRAARMDVWHVGALARNARLALQASPFYHDVLVPNGLARGSGLVAPLALGEGWLCIAYSRPADDRFGIEGGMDLLRMLLPAFRAGVHALHRLEDGRGALADALDSLGQAVIVYDMDARERCRSTGVQRLLAEEPDADRIAEEMRAAARAVVRQRTRRRKSAPVQTAPARQREITTARAHYRLRAAFSPGAAEDRDASVLVTIARDPVLPTAASLRNRYPLTAREAEVALLVATGASDREVADRLGISPHTVRTHTEHIYRKLGIHSRKALALRFLR